MMLRFFMVGVSLRERVSDPFQHAQTTQVGVADANREKRDWHPQRVSKSRRIWSAPLPLDKGLKGVPRVDINGSVDRLVPRLNEPADGPIGSPIYEGFKIVRPIV